MRQMSEDSKSLHRSLSTINSKMREPGNVVDLRALLKAERKENNDLRARIKILLNELKEHGYDYTSKQCLTFECNLLITINR